MQSVISASAIGSAEAAAAPIIPRISNFVGIEVTALSRFARRTATPAATF